AAWHRGRRRPGDHPQHLPAPVCAIPPREVLGLRSGAGQAGRRNLGHAGGGLPALVFALARGCSTGILPSVAAPQRERTNLGPGAGGLGVASSPRPNAHAPPRIAISWTDRLPSEAQMSRYLWLTLGVAGLCAMSTSSCSCSDNGVGKNDGGSDDQGVSDD